MIVVGATNRPDLLDPALLRPGRFDKILNVPPPNETSRAEILQIATSQTPLAPQIDLDRTAKLTSGYSGADLRNLCQEAVLKAMSEQGLEKIQRVEESEWEWVFQHFQPSLNQSLIQRYQSMNIQ